MDLIECIKHKWDKDELICFLLSVDWNMHIGSTINKASLSHYSIHYGLNEDKTKVYFFSLFPFKLLDGIKKLHIENGTVFETTIKRDYKYYNQKINRRETYSFDLYICEVSIEKIINTGFTSIAYVDCNEDYPILKENIKGKMDIDYTNHNNILSILKEKWERKENPDFLKVFNCRNFIYKSN